MIKHVFISLSVVQIYDISYIHLHWLIWPGTSRRPGENRSGQLGQDELLVTEVGGRLVANLFAFEASSRVMGWKTFKGRGVVYILLFCHLHISPGYNYQCKLRLHKEQCQ